MRGRFFIAAMAALPKHGLSRLTGAAARSRWLGPVRRAAMRRFAARYGVDLSESPPLEEYRTFGEFFARPLLPGRRPVAPGEAVVVSPVDGVVSECGVAQTGRLLQAKGIDYTAEALLADGALARRFDGGAWVTLYLSPRDYHRIHFPIGGGIVGWRYVPGALWPVNPAAVANVRGLFTRNERLVTLLETPVGLCAVVAVGATVVGRVRAFYDDNVPATNGRHAAPQRRDYPAPVPVEKGAELGAFELGSTVILLFEPGRVVLEPVVAAGTPVRVGQAIGRGSPDRRR